MTIFEQAMERMLAQQAADRVALKASKSEIERYEQSADKYQAVPVVSVINGKASVFYSVRPYDEKTGKFFDSYSAEMEEALRHSAPADMTSRNPIMAVEIDGQVFNVWKERK